MFHFSRLTLSMLMLGLLLTLGCRRESDPAPNNPQEVITTVVLRLTPTTGGATQVASWAQTDLSGATPPDTSQAILNLTAGVSYNATVWFLDASKSPVDSIHLEVLEEADEHLVLYQPTPTASPLVIPATPNDTTVGLLNLQVVTSDADGNGLPLGLQTTFITGTASTGRVRVALRHQPGAKDGTYAPGDTDVDVYFRVNITN